MLLYQTGRVSIGDRVGRLWPLIQYSWSPDAERTQVTTWVNANLRPAPWEHLETQPSKGRMCRCWCITEWVTRMLLWLCWSVLTCVSLSSFFGYRSRLCMITQLPTVMSCSWRPGMWCLWFHLRTLRSRWAGKTGCVPGLGWAKGISGAASSSTNSLAVCRVISLWLEAGCKASCSCPCLPATEEDGLWLESGDIILHKACEAAMVSCPFRGIWAKAMAFVTGSQTEPKLSSWSSCTVSVTTAVQTVVLAGTTQSFPKDSVWPGDGSRTTGWSRMPNSREHASCPSLAWI